MSARRILGMSVVVILLFARPGFGWKMFSTDAPNSGLLNNSFIDILYNDGTVWVASGHGLSYSSDLGRTWYTLTTETNPGLASDQPSGLYGRPGQVWVGGSHSEAYEGINYPFGDGISLSTDGGGTWETFRPPEASDFGKLVYDLTGADSSVYAACFYGGFIVKHGSDTTWTHLFFSPVDSADWAYDDWPDLNSGRYYSCAADTTHADSLIIYGGSAYGINKFYYLPKRIKLGGDKIYAIIPAGGFIYLANDGGVTQVDTLLKTFYSTDRTNGLPGNLVEHLAIYGNRLWAAVFDPVDSSGLGLYYRDDPDSEWTVMAQDTVGPSDFWSQNAAGLFSGPASGVYDFAMRDDSVQSVLYAAAGDSGLYRTTDTGTTWERLYIDPSDSDQSSPRNQVYSIDLTPDSIFLGTKAGLVVAAYTPPFTITYDTVMTFPEDDSTGSFVSFVRHQDNDSASFTWIGVEPQTPAGNSAVLFLDPDAVNSTRLTRFLVGSPTQGIYIKLYDAYLTENLTSLATSIGLFKSLNFPSVVGLAKYTVADPTSGRTLDSYDFLSVDIINGKLFTGTTGGFGYRVASNEWRIFIANTDPLTHDLAVGLRYENVDLPGDWVVALAVQPYDTSAILWAGCRRVPDTTAQINAVGFSTDYGATWNEALPNIRAWNFAFDAGGTAYVAASEGLFSAPPPWDTWKRKALIDPVTSDTIAANTEVFSVEVVDSVLFVGTELGLAIKHLNPDSSWAITRVFAPTSTNDDVYAAPVPYSPLNNNGRLSLHYHVDESAEVTVKIYDFAMNLVRVVAENKYRAGGADYFESWDGYNGRGDMVATGFYYFKVSYSTGHERWGRLAIIP